MPSLDLFTIHCITIANMYLSSGAMYFVSQLNGRHSGMRYCAVAGFITATGFALAPFETLLPGHLMNVLARVLIFWGASLTVRGIRRFRSLQLVPRYRFTRGMLLYGGLFAVFQYVNDSPRARVVITSLLLAAVMGIAAWSMGVKVKRRERPVYWMTAGVYAAHALTLIIRAFWYMRASPHPSLFAADPVDLLTIMMVNLSAMGGAFGLCLATNLRLMHEAEKLALYDPLTGLPNRRLLEDRLARAERRACDSRVPLALIFCDLDDFKNVNDTLGHHGGDKVLREVGDRLRRFAVIDSCLARVGGDEFILLIENAAKREDLEKLVANLCRAVSEPMHIEGRSITISISCGLAVYPDDVESTSDLVRIADAAMYSIKHHDRMVWSVGR
jgi:diguanylate cyclase (GGDEF)-like protein